MPESLFLHELKFLKPAGTSRGVLHTKPSWIYKYSLSNGRVAQTEFPVIPGLSPEYVSHAQYENDLKHFLHLAKVHLEFWSTLDFMNDPHYQSFISNWQAFPSFIFGLEVLLLSIRAEAEAILFQTPFTKARTSIPINGLVWMGSLADMRMQAKQKIAEGFQTVKLKIGALNWQQERSLIEELRSVAPADQLTIRVDANGAFSAQQAHKVLEELALLEVHSIEQPIAAGQQQQMAQLVEKKILPIALDEELIGVHFKEQKMALLQVIQPTYIILKPSLHGGFSGVAEWISLAEQRNIGWWLTSALESSIGLSAIVQFGSNYPLHLPQGFGTGALYSNNLESTLGIKNGHIYWLTDSSKG